VSGLGACDSVLGLADDFAGPLDGVAADIRNLVLECVILSLGLFQLLFGERVRGLRLLLSLQLGGVSLPFCGSLGSVGLCLCSGLGSSSPSLGFDSLGIDLLDRYLNGARRGRGRCWLRLGLRLGHRLAGLLVGKGRISLDLGCSNLGSGIVRLLRLGWLLRLSWLLRLGWLFSLDALRSRFLLALELIDFSGKALQGTLFSLGRLELLAQLCLEHLLLEAAILTAAVG